MEKIHQVDNTFRIVVICNQIPLYFLLFTVLGTIPRYRGLKFSLWFNFFPPGYWYTYHISVFIVRLSRSHLKKKKSYSYSPLYSYCHLNAPCEVNTTLYFFLPLHLQTLNTPRRIMVEGHLFFLHETIHHREFHDL